MIRPTAATAVPGLADDTWLQAVINTIDRGIIVCDRNAQVLVANNAGIELLDRVRGGKGRSVSRSAADRELRRFVREVIRTGKRHAYTLDQPAWAAFAFCDIMPLRINAARAAHVLVLFRQPTCEGLSNGTAAATYGLTRAERHIAGLLISGHSAREIANIRRRELNTVQTQVKSLMRKTGTRHQLQLVARLRALA